MKQPDFDTVNGTGVHSNFNVLNFSPKWAQSKRS